MSGQFVKGQSGNPSGRPKVRRPNISAFDIIFDKTLTVRQGSVKREITIDEALELKTYQAALMGSRPAMRIILKMIARREHALQKAAPKPASTMKPSTFNYPTNSADEAMLLLDIICSNPRSPEPDSPRPRLVATWAAQAAISRPGRAKLSVGKKDGLQQFIKDSASLRWPRGRADG